MFGFNAAQNSSQSEFSWMENTAKVFNVGSPSTLILIVVLFFATILLSAAVVATISIMAAKKMWKRFSDSSSSKEGLKTNLLHSDSFCEDSSPSNPHKLSGAGYWWDEDFIC